MADHLANLKQDERALSPVVEKTFASGLALLYIGSMMGLLLGGVVPPYETATSEELSERTLATAASHVEDTVPETDGEVMVSKTVDLPETIQNTGYRLTLDGEVLTLEHPDADVERETSVVLDERIETAEGDVSGGTVVIYVEGEAGERTVQLKKPERDGT